MSRPPPRPTPRRRAPEAASPSGARQLPGPPGVIPPDLLRAYNETDYRVLAEPPFTLRIDEPSTALARVHASHGVDRSAFITAFNPFSEPQDDASNAMHQAQLMAQLRARGFSYIEGVGAHPSGNWHGEDSVLVLGITLEDARALGVLLRQNAIVWAGRDAVPRLVLLRQG